MKLRWNDTVTDDMTEIAVKLRDSTRYHADGVKMLELLSFMAERLAIERSEGWIEWGARGPCPVEDGTIVDVMLFNGQEVYDIQAFGDKTTAHTRNAATGLAWSRAKRDGIKAYRLSKGTAR